MHNTIKNLLDIENNIKSYLSKSNTKKPVKVIAVSKTFDLEKILPLIDYGHVDYGENKVQEAVEKWTEIKKNKSEIKLHMIGKLQTNKVKLAVQIFDYIHSVDSEKLAKKIAEEQLKINKKIKIFLQVNIGDENQKSGANKNDIQKLVFLCNDLQLEVIGLMCIPPANLDPNKYFIDMKELSETFGFTELSMGMSLDYMLAIKNNSTYVRIGSSIFGQRS